MCIALSRRGDLKSRARGASRRKETFALAVVQVKVKVNGEMRQTKRSVVSCQDRRVRLWDDRNVLFNVLLGVQIMLTETSLGSDWPESGI